MRKIVNFYRIIRKRREKKEGKNETFLHHHIRNDERIKITQKVLLMTNKMLVKCEFKCARKEMKKKLQEGGRKT